MISKLGTAFGTWSYSIPRKHVMELHFTTEKIDHSPLKKELTGQALSSPDCCCVRRLYERQWSVARLQYKFASTTNPSATVPDILHAKLLAVNASGQTEARAWPKPSGPLHRQTCPRAAVKPTFGTIWTLLGIMHFDAA